MKKDVLHKIGFIAAMIGLALAIIAGIFLQLNGVVMLVLVILGIVYGALSANTKEIMMVLMAAVALVVVGTTGFGPLDDIFVGFGDAMNGIIDYFARFATPAAVIAAIRALILVARNP